MGWIRDLFSPTDNTIEDLQPQREERFPRHTYGIGHPIVVHRQELNDIAHLLELENKAPNSWDNSPLLNREDIEEVIEETVSDIGEVPSPEERRGEIDEIIESWQEQLTNSEDAVWTTIGIDYRFKIYINHCERRADLGKDDFEEPEELDTARMILNRIQAAQDSDAKRAMVHKSNLPLEEPE